MQFTVVFSHATSGNSARANVSIILNQIVVWLDSEIQWNIYDLRNVVKALLQNELAKVAYLRGYAYDVEVTRVMHRELEIDQVFGIDIPCIANRNASIDLNERIASIRQKTVGPEGVLLHRCFNDLVAAMQHPDDTGFYCYRAIEALRHHCRARHAIDPQNKPQQWQKLREVTGIEEATFRFIQNAANPVRHGNVVSVTGQDRVELFTRTWDIVDAYLASLNESDTVEDRH